MKKAIITIIVTLFLASMLSMAFVTPAKAQYLVDPYAVALWHIDEGTGSTVYDATANHNDGTISGATWVDGKFGKALYFDGINDYVEVSSSSSLQISSQGTIEFWFNPSAGFGGHDAFILKGVATGTGSHLDLEYGVNRHAHDGSIKGWISDHTGFDMIFTTTKTWTVGTWYHIAFTWNGTALQIYVNGVSDAEPVPQTRNAYVSTDPMTMGRIRAHWYNGILDEVRISNIARPPLDIDPDTLNLKSKGKWISAYIRVPGWHQLFRDDFEQSTIGSDWQCISGMWTIEDDTRDDMATMVLSGVGGSYVGEVVAVSGSSDWTDYIFEMDVKKASGNYFNIVFRYVDTGNYYLLEPSADEVHIALFKRVNNVFTELAPRPSQSTTVGTWYHYKFVIGTSALGTRIQVFVDGVQRFDVVDNTPELAKGKIGVGSWSGSDAHFDNVIATTYVSEIDINNVVLHNGVNGAVSAVSDPKYEFVTDMFAYAVDVDGEGTLERLVKFDRMEVINGLDPGDYTFTVNAIQLDETELVYPYAIRLIKPGK